MLKSRYNVKTKMHEITLRIAGMNYHTHTSDKKFYAFASIMPLNHEFKIVLYVAEGDEGVPFKGVCEYRTPVFLPFSLGGVYD